MGGTLDAAAVAAVAAGASAFAGVSAIGDAAIAALGEASIYDPYGGMVAQPPAQTAMPIQTAMPMQSLLAAQSAIGRPLIDLNDRDACRIFVGSLPFECGDRELRALVDQVPFKPTTQGTSLQECRVLPGKGCGYIKFGSWEAAEE